MSRGVWLTATQVDLIEKACAYGSDQDVAKQFKISASTVNRIRNQQRRRREMAEQVRVSKGNADAPENPKRR